MKTILYELQESDDMNGTYSWCLIQFTENPNDSRMAFFSTYTDDTDNTFGVIQSIAIIESFTVTPHKVYNPGYRDLWVRKLEFRTSELIETGVLYDLDSLPPELKELMPELFL